MKQLIKLAKPLGNASGVLLPKEWENSLIKVELVRPSFNKMELLQLLNKYVGLEKVVGVYLVGSYAREEVSVDSDIDVLVISDNVDKDLKIKGYEITVVPSSIIDLQKGYPFYYSMLIEAKTILNNELLRNYLLGLKLSGIGIKEYIGATMKMIRKSENAIKSSIKEDSKFTYDAVAYSLILRLRGLYILDCVNKNQKYSRKGFLKLVKDIVGSIEIYDRYLIVKNSKKVSLDKVRVSDAEKIILYLKMGLKKWEKIIKEEEKY